MKIRRFNKADAIEASRLIKECYLKLEIGGHTERGTGFQIFGNSVENLIKRSESINYFVAIDNSKEVGIYRYDKQQYILGL